MKIQRPTVEVSLVEFGWNEKGILKRYFFPKVGDRLRGLHRHTGWGTPKPQREAENFRLLNSCGAEVAQPLAWAVERYGWVRDGWILTRWFAEGQSLEDYLNRFETMDPELLRVAGQSLQTLHDSGCWYRKTAARNLLVRSYPYGRGFGSVWIDAAAARWPENGPQDWQRHWDLALMWVPLATKYPNLSWPEFCSGYEYSLPPAAESLVDILPWSWQRRLKKVLRREIDRPSD